MTSIPISAAAWRTISLAVDCTQDRARPELEPPRDPFNLSRHPRSSAPPPLLGDLAEPAQVHLAGAEGRDLLDQEEIVLRRDPELRDRAGVETATDLLDRHPQPGVEHAEPLAALGVGERGDGH